MAMMRGDGDGRRSPRISAIVLFFLATVAGGGMALGAYLFQLLASENEAPDFVKNLERPTPVAPHTALPAPQPRVEPLDDETGDRWTDLGDIGANVSR